MAAVVDDEPTLLRFHSRKHSLDQAQGSEDVHVKHLLGHFHGNTFQGGQDTDAGVIDCE